MKLSIVEESLLIKCIKKELPHINFDSLSVKRKKEIIDNATRIILDTVN